MTTTTDAARTEVEEPLAHLRTAGDGLSAREAARRLVVYGPNALQHKQKRHRLRALARQVVHPGHVLTVDRHVRSIRHRR